MQIEIALPMAEQKHGDSQAPIDGIGAASGLNMMASGEILVDCPAIDDTSTPLVGLRTWYGRRPKFAEDSAGDRCVGHGSYALRTAGRSATPSAMRATSTALAIAVNGAPMPTITAEAGKSPSGLTPMMSSVLRLITRPLIWCGTRVCSSVTVVAPTPT